MNEKISDSEILYDPMFAKKPPEGWEDSEKGGLFGKAVFKKAVFIFFLVAAIAASLSFSFRVLGKEKYSYTESDNGIMLSEFQGSENDRFLEIDFVTTDDGTKDRTKSVSAVRNYAVCCNEYLELIFIGKDVSTLEDNCFYYCTSLKAIIVDSNNPYFTSVDGVLYNKEMTEIILHPIKNNEYRTALATGLSAPVSVEDAAAFLAAGKEIFSTDEDNRSEEIKEKLDSIGAYYEIPDTVTEIAPFCFNYCDKMKKIDIPSGVTQIGQMAFFKCSSLEEITLPDGLESIGPDGLSYCENLTYIYVPGSVKTIGHHAFYGCLGCDGIYMGAKDKNDVETGESWLPKKSTKSLSNVDVLYGQERRNS